jgi:hypothetical protein
MKNLFQLLKNSTVEKWDYLASSFSLSGKRDTSLKNGTIPLKSGGLVTLNYFVMASKHNQLN